MENKKLCEKCGGELILDEWHGWVWMCGVCDKTYGVATDEEICALAASRKGRFNLTSECNMFPQKPVQGEWRG